MSLRPCERCGHGWRSRRSRWCRTCRHDLTETLSAERLAQQQHGHDWDLADILRAIDRWATTTVGQQPSERPR